MRLTVLGATGRIGRHVLAQAVEAGHDVTVLVRDAESLNEVAPAGGVRVVQGGIGDPEAVARAVEGADAVIHAVGPAANTPEQVEELRRGMRHLLTAMGRHGVRRLVSLSGAAVDAEGDRKPVIDRVASRLVRVVVRHVVRARQAEYDELAASDLEWVAVRPPIVTDGPLTRRYRVGADVLRPGGRISRADVADFMLAQAVKPTHVRQAPFTCTRPSRQGINARSAARDDPTGMHGAAPAGHAEATRLLRLPRGA
jgi:putative NADH-flavin reductase